MNLQRIIWIASFPKSGNTWMRLLLAHLFLPRDKEIDINSINLFTLSDQRQDFYDKANGGPFRTEDPAVWIRMRQKAVRLIAASKPPHHFVKTHARIARVEGFPLIPPDVTAGAIYMLRNPFDVAISYARHMSVSIDESIALMADPDTTNGRATGILELVGRWDHHSRDWLGAPGLRLHKLRYEDLLTETEAEMRRLLGFLGAKVTDGDLRRAIRKTRFSELQKQEKQKGFKERPPQMKQFFHSGTAGGWREKLTPEQIGRIREEFADAIEQHYPELMDESADLARGAA